MVPYSAAAEILAAELRGEGAVCHGTRIIITNYLGLCGNTNVLESNRFPVECQNLTGDIFMARSRVLVYSIGLVILSW